MNGGRRHASSRGSTSVEFILGATLVLLPLVAAILELSQLTVARYSLGYAVSQAARASALGAPDPLLSRKELAIGLLPLLLRETSVSSVPSAAAAAALLEGARPDLLGVEIEEWPALEGESADTVGGLHRQRLRVSYCRELFFSPMKQILPSILAWSAEDVFDLACLARDRVPLKAWAPVLRATFQTTPFETTPGVERSLPE